MPSVLHILSPTIILPMVINTFYRWRNRSRGAGNDSAWIWTLVWLTPCDPTLFTCSVSVLLHPQDQHPQWEIHQEARKVCLCVGAGGQGGGLLQQGVCGLGWGVRGWVKWGPEAEGLFSFLVFNCLFQAPCESGGHGCAHGWPCLLVGEMGHPTLERPEF